VTDPSPVPCRTAVRAGSWRPFGPHTASTSAFIIAAITCSPRGRRWSRGPAAGPAAAASPDSHREQALLHIAGQPASTIDTASGSTGVIALVAFFW